MAVRFLLSLTLAVALAGCSSQRTEPSRTSAGRTAAPSESAGLLAPPPTAPAIAAPTSVENGRRIFLENCARCHGKNADADTPVGYAWNVPVLRSAQVQSLSDEQLRAVIHKGRGKMPPWEALLSDTDINHVLAYVRSLKKL